MVLTLWKYVKAALMSNSMTTFAQMTVCKVKDNAWCEEADLELSETLQYPLTPRVC